MRIYGYHPVREALRSRPHEIERVWISRRRGGARRREVEELCRRHQLPREVVDEKELAALAGDAGAVHNGFVAALRPGGERGVVAADPHLLVIAEDVQDPRNLGALLRVCEGAGVGRVLLRDRGSSPISPTVVKAAAGAAAHLAVERIPNTAAAVAGLKERGFWVYGADAAGELPWQVDLTGKVVLCFGGEEKGLRSRTRQVCDRLIGLPMRGRIESLNLATAAAALLYEAIRQRTALPGPRLPVKL